MATQHPQDRIAGGPAAPARADRTTDGRSDHDDNNAERRRFIDRVSAAVDNGATIAVGSVQVLSLDRSFDANGDHRGNNSTLDDEVAKVLPGLLGPEDVCTRCRDGIYLIVFGDMTGAAAEARGQEIVASVRRSLGEVDRANAFSVKSIVTDVDTGSLVNETTILAAIEATLSARAAGTAMPSPLAPTAGGAPSPEASRSALAATYQYRPLWDAKRALMAYLIELGPVMNSPTSSLHGGTLQSVEKIDHAILQNAHDVMNTLSKSERLSAIVCPVHFETLVTPPSRQIYLRYLKEIPVEWRQLLFLEIIEISPDANQGEMVDAALGVSRACRSVHLRLNLRRPMKFDPSKGRVAAVGVELSGASTSQAEMMHFLDVFASVGRMWNVATFAHGVHSLSLATSAVCAGYRFLSGDAVSPPVARIDGSYRFRQTDLFSHLDPQGNWAVDS